MTTLSKSQIFFFFCDFLMLVCFPNPQIPIFSRGNPEILLHNMSIPDIQFWLGMKFQMPKIFKSQNPTILRLSSANPNFKNGKSWIPENPSSSITPSPTDRYNTICCPVLRREYCNLPLKRPWTSKLALMFYKGVGAPTNMLISGGKMRFSQSWGWALKRWWVLERENTVTFIYYPFGYICKYMNTWINLHKLAW